MLKITILTLLLTAATQAATIPTSGEIAAALASAKQEWRAELPDAVEFRLEPLNPCNLRDYPRIAQTQPLDTITTLTFDDGAEPSVSHRVLWIIRLNSNCDWSRLNLRKTVIHEIGHILIGAAYHSKNRRSVMYWVVAGNQEILAEDRAMMVVSK